MILPPPSYTHTATLLPSPPLFPSLVLSRHQHRLAIAGAIELHRAPGDARRSRLLLEHPRFRRQLLRRAAAGRSRAGHAGASPQGGAVADAADPRGLLAGRRRSEEHTSELQSLMRISYAVFCLIKKKKQNKDSHETQYKHKK